MLALAGVRAVGLARPLGTSLALDTAKADCRAVAQELGLVEGRDFERVCLGERGFRMMIDDLAGSNSTIGNCDIGASAITASSEREDLGISFSRATYRGSLAIMKFAPLKKRGMWAFFKPLHVYVWMALLVTILVTPFFVFFFESVFSGRCAFTLTFFFVRWCGMMCTERL